MAATARHPSAWASCQARPDGPGSTCSAQSRARCEAVRGRCRAETPGRARARPPRAGRSGRWPRRSGSCMPCRPRSESRPWTARRGARTPRVRPGTAARPRSRPGPWDPHRGARARAGSTPVPRRGTRAGGRLDATQPPEGRGPIGRPWTRVEGHCPISMASHNATNAASPSTSGGRKSSPTKQLCSAAFP